MTDFWDEFFSSFDDTWGLFAIALGILVVGLIVARLVRKFLLRLFERTHLDDQFAQWLGQEDPSELNLRIAGFVSILLRLLTIYIFFRFSYSIEPVQMLVDAVVEIITDLSQQDVVTAIFRIILLSFATWVLARLVRVANSLFERLYGDIDGWRHTRIKSIKIQRLELLTADRLTDGLIIIARYLRVFAIILLVLVYLAVVFSFFPQTQDVVTGLISRIWEVITQGWQGFVNYLPSLLNLILIFFATRYLLRFIHFIAREIGKGNITLAGFYPEWSEPTYQIVRIILIALVLVIAFPFLPGSASPAFQGITIFVGFLFSLGSTSVVANIVAGIVLTYTRAFKVGDRVKISDTMGDIVERTLLVTRIRTIKNVDITVPNGMVLSSHIINYSSSANKHGLILHKTLTLGYDVPWPQVHEVLIDAALATSFILEEPKPFVFQTSLDDFYVSYEINAFTDEPNKMDEIYSELHKNIQDKCNQAGIEILSPHYAALRDGQRSAIAQEYLPKDNSPAGNRVGKEE